MPLRWRLRGERPGREHVTWVACPFARHEGGVSHVTWHECRLAVLRHMCPRSRRGQPSYHVRDFELEDEQLGADAAPWTPVDPYETRVLRRRPAGLWCSREQFHSDDDEDARLQMVCRGASRRATDKAFEQWLRRARRSWQAWRARVYGVRCQGRKV